MVKDFSEPTVLKLLLLCLRDQLAQGKRRAIKDVHAVLCHLERLVGVENVEDLFTEVLVLEKKEEYIAEEQKRIVQALMRGLEPSVLDKTRDLTTTTLGFGSFLKDVRNFGKEKPEKTLAKRQSREKATN